MKRWSAFFCGKLQREVQCLIAGPKAFICNEGNEIVLEICVERELKKPPTFDGFGLRQRRRLEAKWRRLTTVRWASAAVSSIEGLEGDALKDALISFSGHLQKRVYDRAFEAGCEWQKNQNRNPYEGWVRPYNGLEQEAAESAENAVLMLSKFEKDNAQTILGGFFKRAQQRAYEHGLVGPKA